MLISIIIINYNSERYIERCINSLLCQLNNETELIIVDDCSTDNGVEGIKRLIGVSNKNTKLICNQTNLGVAETRNIGIMSATGEYLIFVDSDDYVTDDYVSTLTNSIKDSHSDILLFDFTLCDSNGSKKVQNPEFSSKEAYISALLQSRMHNSLWNKLIRRNLIIENDIFMPLSINMFEDKSICYKLFYYAKSVTNTKRNIYFYDTTNANSITRQNPKRHIAPALVLLDGVDSFFSDKTVPLLINDAIQINKVLICGLIALYGSEDIRTNEQFRFKNIPIRHFFKGGKIPLHYRLSALLYRYNCTLLLTAFHQVIKFLN